MCGGGLRLERWTKMNLSEFQQFAAGRGWKVVEQTALGTSKGYPFSARFQSQGGGSISIAFRIDASMTLKALKTMRKALPKGFGLALGALEETGITLSCLVKRAEDLSLALPQAMDVVTAGLRELGSVPPQTCPICRKPGCDATAMVRGHVAVHAACMERFGQQAMTNAQEGLKGNYFTGLIGALLGGLVGAVPAVLCLNFMDYYVGLLYALIPLGASYGYKLFKGKRNQMSFVCTLLSSVLNLATVEFLTIYIQLGMVRESLPTLGFAMRTFLSYVESGDIFASGVMNLVWLAVGIYLAWRTISHTATHEAQSARFVMDTLTPMDETATADTQN